MSDPQATFQRLIQSNQQFQRFMADNRGKTPQQIAQEHGIDMGAVMRMMGGAVNGR